MSWMPLKRKAMVAVMILGGGTLFQALTAGCGNYWLNAAVSGFDFCSVLNCSGSSFFDFCGNSILLIDCPNLLDQQ